eukprot:GILJ01021484.1.p1 GENE.GILJ01021484.1~~GILJ01021484.1.p1  ORF type:complete len:154 (+),score=15.35 GILJ01021484.1:89-550(+)
MSPLLSSLHTTPLSSLRNSELGIAQNNINAQPTVVAIVQLPVPADAINYVPWRRLRKNCHHFHFRKYEQPTQTRTNQVPTVRSLPGCGHCTLAVRQLTHNFIQRDPNAEVEAAVLASFKNLSDSAFKFAISAASAAASSSSCRFNVFAFSAAS